MIHGLCSTEQPTWHSPLKEVCMHATLRAQQEAAGQWQYFLAYLLVYLSTKAVMFMKFICCYKH